MTEVASQSTRPRPFRFSVGSLLLVVTVVCLATALVLTNRKLAQTERELTTLQPLSAEEVAQQFEKCTKLGPISTTVKDVRYSPTDDAYKVSFSWVDAISRKTWHTEVKLTADGYGTYFGIIRSGEFIRPLGHKDGFSVSVKTSSPLKK